MNDSNSRTLQSYNAHVQEYVDGTAHRLPDTTLEWIDQNLAALDKSAQILEIGSGFGRDADYMEATGYRVERSDGSEAFVKLLRNQGKAAQLLNIVTSPIEGQYDMIFAHAVLLHFTPDETRAVIAKVYEALKPAGRFVFSVKRGDGEEWSKEKLHAPRYFCYWQPEAITRVLNEAGFANVTQALVPHYRANDHDFILLTAIKGAAA